MHMKQQQQVGATRLQQGSPNNTCSHTVPSAPHPKVGIQRLQRGGAQRQLKARVAPLPLLPLVDHHPPVITLAASNKAA